MNRANISEVLATLQALRTNNHAARFDMGYWFRLPGVMFGRFVQVLDRLGVEPEAVNQPNANCGTASCLAGWTQAVLAKTETQRSLRAEVFARDAFGLSARQAEFWFYGGWATDEDQISGDLESITLDQAIAFLRGVLATGEPMFRLNADQESGA